MEPFVVSKMGRRFDMVREREVGCTLIVNKLLDHISKMALWTSSVSFSLWLSYETSERMVAEMGCPPMESEETSRRR